MPAADKDQDSISRHRDLLQVREDPDVSLVPPGDQVRANIPIARTHARDREVEA
ncbi:MAG: hypothetical protein H0U67_01070 [Gemmatimonadetes bacterium]|nr:hypothetical protein [Gemmatimonadota bacterium]